jgi:hypothetical protein
MVEVVMVENMVGKNYMVFDFEVDNTTNLFVLQHDTHPSVPVLRFEADKRDVAVMGEMFRCYGLRRYEYTYRTKVS